jgi:hypothetical protein
MPDTAVRVTYCETCCNSDPSNVSMISLPPRIRGDNHCVHAVEVVRYLVWLLYSPLKTPPWTNEPRRLLICVAVAVVSALRAFDVVHNRAEDVGSDGFQAADALSYRPLAGVLCVEDEQNTVYLRG